MAHPRIDGCGSGVVQVDVSRGARVLVGEEERFLTLKDLEGLRHVGRAGHAGLIALHFRVARQPVLLVLAFLRERRRLIGDRPVHDANARWDRADGAERDHFFGGNGTVGARPQLKRRASHVLFEVVVGLVQRLPDSVQVGFAGNPCGPSRRLSLAGHHRQSGDEHGGHCR